VGRGLLSRAKRAAVVVAVLVVGLAPTGSAFGATAYATSAGGQLYTVDTTTWQTAVKGPVAEPIAALTVGLDETLLAIGGSDSRDQALYTLNRETGATTPVGALVSPGASETYFDGLASVPGGKLFTAATTSDFSGFESQLYAVSRSTGAATPVGSPQPDVAFSGFAGACDGTLLAVDAATLWLVRVSPKTGAVAPVGPLQPGLSGSDAVDIAFDHAHRKLYAIAIEAGNLPRIYSVDASTGTLTATPFAAPSGGDLDTLTVTSPAACRYSRKLTISYSGSKSAFTGRIESQRAACERQAAVSVFRQRPGADARVGKDKTDSKGRYAVDSPKRAGTYYARTPRTASPTSGVCLAATSSKLG